MPGDIQPADLAAAEVIDSFAMLVERVVSASTSANARTSSRARRAFWARPPRAEPAWLAFHGRREASTGNDFCWLPIKGAAAAVPGHDAHGCKFAVSTARFCLVASRESILGASPSASMETRSSALRLSGSASAKAVHWGHERLV